MLMNLGVAAFVTLLLASAHAHAAAAHHLLIARLPTCNGLGMQRARPPSAEAPSRFFAKEDNEIALKKRFKKLAAELHPDVNAGSPEANAAFQELTAEYSRLRQECRTAAQREELEEAWLSLGGLAAAVTLVFSTAPIVPAAVAAVTGLSKAGGYLSERSPAKYAEITRAAVEAYAPVEQRAVEAERVAAATAAAEEAALSASLRRQAAAALLCYNAQAEEARAAVEAARLAAEAFEPRIVRYKNRAKAALDRRVLARIDRLSVWWTRRRSRYRREQRAAAAIQLAAETAAKRADVAAQLAEARRSTAAAAEAEAKTRAESLQEASRVAGLRSDEVAEALAEMEDRRRAAQVAAATQSDLQSVGEQVSGFAKALSGALGEGLAFTVDSLLSANATQNGGAEDEASAVQNGGAEDEAGAVQNGGAKDEIASTTQEVVEAIRSAQEQIRRAKLDGNWQAAETAREALQEAERALRQAQQREAEQRQR